MASHREIKKVLALACMSVLVSAATALSGGTALANELDDAQAAADAARGAYDACVAQYEEQLGERDRVQAEVEQLKAKLAADRPVAYEAMRSAYRDPGARLSTLVEIVLSGENISQIIDDVDYAVKVFDYQAGVLDSTSRNVKALEEKEVQLDQSIADCEAKKAELNSVLEEALAEYNRLKSWSSDATASASGDTAANLVIGDVASEINVSVDELMFSGVIYANGYRYTYYSESVLPGYGLDIPGRHHSGGKVCDGDGYVCVASSDLPEGTVVPTPVGTGKVYDSGCASGTLDIYVV